MANLFQRLFGMGPMGSSWPGTPGINPNAPMPGVMTGPGGFGGIGGPLAPAPQSQAAPKFAGPPWLQKIAGGFNRVSSGLAGPDDPNLTPQENEARRRQQQLTMAAALLQASAPRPKGSGSAVADFGTALLAGQQAGSQFTNDALRARLMRAQMQQAQQGAQDPATIREMVALGYPLTPDGFKEYNAAQARPGTTINVGESELDKPIPIAQLDTVRLPDGTTPPLGTTMRQAREMGAKVLSAEDQKRTQQADQALGILNQLEALAIGPDGVFREVEPGLANRAASAIEFGIDMLEQKDPRASQFVDMSKATLAPFIKFLGETGSLAQGDVERALGLVPRVFPLPDTEQVAKEKLSSLREIITRGVRNMNSVTRQSEDMPPLPPGFQLDPP